MRASRVDWNGEAAIQYRTGGVTIVVAPERGAKIVSLRDAAGTEWLAGPELPLRAPARDGAEFILAEMCGWDECAPSIVSCTLPGGVDVPDHGELWTRPWSIQANTATVEGESYGYRFSRTITASGDNVVRIEYEVRTRSWEAVFLWAAHPQFLAPPGTRVRLPEIAEVVDVLGENPVRLPWSSGLAEIDTLARGEARKFYLDPEMRAGEASLERPGGIGLTMRWDPELLPYLGVWFDAARYSRENVIAIEPATGWYDSAARALSEDRVLRIAPQSVFSWWLELEFADSSNRPTP